MAYSEAALIRAQNRHKQRLQVHRQAQERQRREILEKLPQAAELDLQLRGTAPRLLSQALRRSQEGEDPQNTLEALRRENQEIQAKLSALLRQGGYAPDALDETPLCPRCRDRGWTGSEMCECLHALCREEQVRELSSMLSLGEQSFEGFSLDYYDSLVWPERGMAPRKNMEVVLSVCRDYARLFGTYPNKNLILAGAPGLGKTYLSACIAREVAAAGHSVVYDTAPNIFRAFENRKFGRGGEETVEQVERYLSCELLIMDDLGSEYSGDFAHAAMYELVNTRLLRERQTVISSNLDLASIQSRYSPQVASRLEGEYLFLVLFGRDVRQVKRSIQQGRTPDLGHP